MKISTVTCRVCKAKLQISCTRCNGSGQMHCEYCDLDSSKCDSEVRNKYNQLAIFKKEYDYWLEVLLPKWEQSMSDAAIKQEQQEVIEIIKFIQNQYKEAEKSANDAYRKEVVRCKDKNKKVKAQRKVFSKDRNYINTPFYTESEILKNAKYEYEEEYERHKSTIKKNEKLVSEYTNDPKNVSIPDFRSNFKYLYAECHPRPKRPEEPKFMNCTFDNRGILLACNFEICPYCNDKKDWTCETCEGKGIVPCGHCQQTGQVPVQIPTSRRQLKNFIENPNIYLEEIDVSKIDDFSYLFYDEKFFEERSSQKEQNLLAVKEHTKEHYEKYNNNYKDLVCCI